MEGPRPVVLQDTVTGEELKEVDYASINYSLLTKTPEEAEKKTTNTESDYAEIKREKKNEGEGSGVMDPEEEQEGEEMMGK